MPAHARTMTRPPFLRAASDSEAATSPPEPRKAAPVALDPAWRPQQAFAAIAFACVQQLEANRAGALLDEDPDFVHQMRVALRRLRSALRLFRAFLPGSFMQAVTPELRWLTGQLSPLRDWDVLLVQSLPGLLRARPGARAGAVERRIAAAAQDAREAAAQALRRALRSRRYAALLRMLVSALTLMRQGTARPPRPKMPLRRLAAAKLRRAQKKLRIKPRALALMEPEARHQVRIAAKRLRYAVEFFSSLYAAKPARRYADHLADLQDALGSLNDQAVALDLVEQLHPAAADLAKFRHRLAEQGGVSLEAAIKAHKRYLRAHPFWQ